MVTYIEEKWHQHSKNILDFFGEAEGIQVGYKECHKDTCDLQN